jgi:valyl-tRNA synthetase
VAQFNLVQEIVRAIRNLRAEKNVKPGQRTPAVFICSHAVAHDLMHEVPMIAPLAWLDADDVMVVAAGKTPFPRPEGYVALVAGPVEIYLPLAGMVDAAEERDRLSKELAETQSQIDRLEKLLASPFAEKAPAPVVLKEREKLAAYQETAEKLRGQLGNL